MVAGEQQHRVGKEGLEEAKLWLESTTRFEVNWTSWGKGGTVQYVQVPQINGKSESFDLAGTHYEPDLTARAGFYAEVKRYSAQGKQREHYRDYLTRCYSATVAWERAGTPMTPEFIWITWHPFGATDDYPKLTTAEMIKEACEALPERVPPEDYDEAVSADLATRLWFLLASPRLEEMRMSQDFLGLVRNHATSEGGGIP
ncbi:MAG: hypothetical protein QOD13_509 [Thermoleophilaceae bacterium]|nr:hypothetical protein [Thermoleophilaceae bacterium]